MDIRNISQEMGVELASREILKKNLEALEAYDQYKEVLDLMKKVDVALGRRFVFEPGASSTMNFEINRYGASTTNAT